MEIADSRTWYVICCVAFFSMATDTKRCYRNVAANSREPITLSLTNMTSHSRRVKYCVLELTSDPGHLLALQISYVPHNKSSHNCSRDYVHVGNDDTAIDKDTMTSYKYCEKTIKEEVVSRDNYLWVVFRMSNIPSLFKLKVKVQVPVTCNSSQFRCSPVQCVPREGVCDGTTDCRNARDEYCKTKETNDGSSTPCFRCKDGTCINPQLQRYHTNWGVKLWYLCDGYSHCPDATDERRDICFRLKGRLNSVFQCVPTDEAFGPNTSVLMWNTILCNKKQDCHNHEDELLEKCLPVTEPSQLHMDVSAVVSVMAFLTAIVTVAIVLFYFEKRRRLKETRLEIRNVSSIRTEVRNAELHEMVRLNCDNNDQDLDIRQTTV